MDWDLKVPASWDLADLEHHDAAAATPAAAAAAGPSGVQHHVNAAAAVRAGPGSGGRAECSVDLKLGGLGECELGQLGRGSREPGKAPAPASSAGVGGAASNKRPRAASGAGQQCPSCAVDGCKADLSKCRDYHRRHKVCEAHSKTPVVVVAGREMRFCQQCSR
ncbi:hypothetical protein PR202_ga21647 [Eleusine coracana subsp. coracana]|uniref:SBP-type domain-containing protein n=1 Tax=Eleusine coracana subsp. coracana TaxID=191504 RepID=A0AAV5D1C8_ELECO|nr:hypothetical protein PR202_ga21647 [Eleusine coracana subsp. coracana]